MAGRIARHGAGVRMAYSQTTPQTVGDAARARIGQEVTYAPIRTDGARVAAELIVARLPYTPAAAPTVAHGQRGALPRGQRG